MRMDPNAQIFLRYLDSINKTIIQLDQIMVVFIFYIPTTTTTTTTTTSFPPLSNYFTLIIIIIIIYIYIYIYLTRIITFPSNVSQALTKNFYSILRFCTILLNYLNDILPSLSSSALIIVLSTSCCSCKSVRLLPTIILST